MLKRLLYTASAAVAAAAQEPWTGDMRLFQSILFRYLVCKVIHNPALSAGSYNIIGLKKKRKIGHFGGVL